MSWFESALRDAVFFFFTHQLFSLLLSIFAEPCRQSSTTWSISMPHVLSVRLWRRYFFHSLSTLIFAAPAGGRVPTTRSGALNYGEWFPQLAHVFKERSVWDIPLVKPHFSCLMDVGPSLQGLDVAEQLGKWMEGFRRGARYVFTTTECEMFHLSLHNKRTRPLLMCIPGFEEYRT